MENGVAVLENSMGGNLKKLKIELPYDPEILLLGIHLRELKAGT